MYCHWMYSLTSPLNPMAICLVQFDKLNIFSHTVIMIFALVSQWWNISHDFWDSTNKIQWRILIINQNEWQQIKITVKELLLLLIIKLILIQQLVYNETKMKIQMKKLLKTSSVLKKWLFQQVSWIFRCQGLSTIIRHRIFLN